MSGKWTLDTFKVETTTEGGDEDAVYANGLMQVLLVVTVSAVNDDNTPHALTNDELSSLKLIDCDGASIKAQDGSVVDTSGSGTFDSKVKITGRRPVDVLFEDLILWQDTNTANGDIGSDYTYDQDNYYLTIKGSRIVRFLDCNGFDGGLSDPYLYGSIGLFSNRMPCYIWYWWPVGPTKEVTAGCRDVNVEITINQQKDAGCLTRLLIDDGPNIWQKCYRWDAKFTVYDQYGNSCVFYPKWVDTWNTLELSKSKTDD